MRPKRNNEVVETIAGVVCSNNYSSVLPVILPGMFKTAVLTSLNKKTLVIKPVTISDYFAYHWTAMCL